MSPALVSLGWRDMNSMVHRRDVSHVYCALHSSTFPPALKALFIRRSEVSQRATRATAAGKLHLDKCRLSSTQHEFSYRAASAWNNLPLAVAQATCRQTF